MNDTAVFEVKCPTSDKNIQRYFCNGQLQTQFRAQIQLQMLFANKTIGYFCIADPKFGRNGEVKVIVKKFNEKFIYAVMKRAESFWKEAVFPILMKYQ